MTGAISLQRSFRPGPTPYQLYGVHVQSSIPLACPVDIASGVADVSIYEAPPDCFTRIARQHKKELAAEDWFHRIALPDGSDYLRWTGLFEFLVSPDGRRIAYCALKHASQETLQTYLVSQALSFALLKQGIEPLHATVVMIGEQAIAFLGDCGYGKSSLGAAFLRAGHAILTDDMLVTSLPNQQQPMVLAHPGPPRIKLFPKIARTLLGRRPRSTPLNPGTAKLIVPLSAREHCGRAVPLRAVYVLRPPTSRRTPKHATIRSLTQREACLALIANTFNTIITEPPRPARQFNWAAQLASAVPVKSLSYPRRLSQIPAVLAAIHKDLAQ